MILPVLNNLPVINYNYKKKSFCNYNSSLGSKLNHDKFEPSFGNIVKYTDAELGKLAKTAINDANKLGEGLEGIVYRIPNTEYCVKIIKSMFSKSPNFGVWQRDVSPQEKANHILAKAENGCLLMKYIPGQSLFKHVKNPDVYNLPLSSYKNLIRQVTEAEELGLRIDPAAANILYNPLNRSLTAIDFYSPNVDFGSYPITGIYTAISDLGLDYYNFQNNKMLAGNLLRIIVEEYEGKSLNKLKINDYDVYRFVHRFGCSWQKNLPPQYKFLEQSFKDMIELNKLKARGENVDRELAGKLKYIKCIVNQIFPE